uniref:Uncharacterized protein n=1 Tax=Glossina austeni TaxID=7395 RepID=A0A1A9UIG0_GLOAU
MERSSLPHFLACTSEPTSSTSTRLPLEVYELTPSGIAGVTELKHKTLEYSTVDGDTLRSSTAIHVQHLATKGPQNTSSQKHTSHSNKDETKDSLIQLQLDRRRSRQMLDIMKQQQHHIEASSHKLHTNLHHLKDVRILYQVGVFKIFFIYLPKFGEMVNLRAGLIVAYTNDYLK